MSESAVSIFMKMDGITGASTFHQERESIECVSWSHAFNQYSSLSRRGGLSDSPGKAVHGEITVEKKVDRTTRDLLKKCWEGSLIPKVTLSSYNSEMKYLEVVLDDVIISHMNINESVNVTESTETICLNYAKVRYMYTPVDDAGAAQGGIPVEHNLETDVVA